MTTPDIMGNRNLVNTVQTFNDKMEGVYTVFATRMIEILDRQEKIEKRQDELRSEIRSDRSVGTEADVEPEVAANDEPLWLEGKIADIDRVLRSHSGEIGKLLKSQRSLSDVVEQHRADGEQLADFERQLERAMRDIVAIDDRTAEELSRCERRFSGLDEQIGEWGRQQGTVLASLDTAQSTVEQQGLALKEMQKKNRKLWTFSVVVAFLAALSLVAGVIA